MNLSWKVKLAVIYDGWKNVIWKNEEVEKIAKERATICAKCDSNKGHVCTECWCPLHAKTKSMKETNECALKKWEK